MKQFSKVVLAVVFAATSAFASTSARPIASLITSGGFAPIPMTKGHGIVILDNGAVMEMNVGELTSVLATLSPEVLSALVRNIDSVKKGTLVDVDAGKPFCADAPNTDYEITNSAGEKIEIAQSSSCHLSQLQDSENAYTILEVLKALNQLTILQ